LEKMKNNILKINWKTINNTIKIKNKSFTVPTKLVNTSGQTL